ncbi:Arabinose efflux permease [Archaeoglobus sulfaticallidus PM70-1]|uniref:Arabinose efflux permease n=1 Tax=Archaeoglobus sulfaticallidus PM70-1 TaxID=387631 RepID=N0BAY4_9EURY|nr:MFS transporter [Archaeoglobus sulfaticallidus]AGK60769.1 Arabinose efflux permease [Archaeoglobus sulfaticallidus PM70-1]
MAGIHLRSGILYFAGFVGYLAGSIVFPIIAPYSMKLGANAFWAGVISGGFALVTSLTMVLFGMIADRFGKYRTSLIGFSLFIVAPLFYIVSRNYIELLLARFLHGLAMAIFVPAINALVIDLSEEGRKGEALGWIATFTMLGYAFGPSIGGYVAEVFGVREVFISCSIVAVIGFVPFLLFRVDERRGSFGFEFDLDKKAMFAAMVPFFATFGSAVISIYSIPLYLPRLGYDYRDIGFLVTFLFLSSALVRVPAGKLSDSIGRLPVIVFGLVIEAIGIFLFLSQSFYAIALGTFLTGLGMGFANPAGFALLSDLVSPEHQGFAMGASSTSLQLAVFLGPAIMGYVTETYGFSFVFILSGMFTALSAVVYLVLSRFIINKPKFK